MAYGEFMNSEIQMRRYYYMKFKYIFLNLIALLAISGCNEAITGMVVDAETGQPIEGAVILVEWTQTKGLPGMSYAESYKVVEVVTDKEGKASIDGALSPFIRGPNVTIYKKGYVAWNNHFIFPDWQRRTDFKWENNYVFKLEKFKPEYSYVKHTSFIHKAHNFGMASEKKQLMKNAYEWEEEKASEEMSNKGKK
jgi:hypothetical protein